MKKTPFKLDRVAVRLVEEPPLLYEEPLDKPEIVVKALGEELKQYDREVVAIIHMQTDCRPINMTIASIGQVNNALASPRELLKAAILSTATGIIMLHNHPSGSLEPSRQDIVLTDKLKMACDLVDVKLLDHIIVGRGKEYFSFEEKEILPPHSIPLSQSLEELKIERSSDQSKISTMERLRQAQKRSGQIRTQREKSSLTMERA